MKEVGRAKKFRYFSLGPRFLFNLIPFFGEKRHKEKNIKERREKIMGLAGIGFFTGGFLVAASASFVVVMPSPSYASSSSVVVAASSSSYGSSGAAPPPPPPPPPEGHPHPPRAAPTAGSTRAVTSPTRPPRRRDRA